MMQINLFPWREYSRKAKKMRFALLSGVAILCALFILMILHLWYNSTYRQQLNLNNFLHSQINAEDTAFSSIGEKQKDKLVLMTQLNVITNLYNRSYQTIKILNELTILVPNSIALNQIAKNASLLNLQGNAQSNSDVTLFIKDLGKSTVFTNPQITSITSGSTVEAHSFQITATLKEVKS